MHATMDGLCAVHPGTPQVLRNLDTSWLAIDDAYRILILGNGCHQDLLLVDSLEKLGHEAKLVSNPDNLGDRWFDTLDLVIVTEPPDLSEMLTAVSTPVLMTPFWLCSIEHGYYHRQVLTAIWELLEIDNLFRVMYSEPIVWWKLGQQLRMAMTSAPVDDRPSIH